MATYRVIPLRDGQDNITNWEVKKNGRHVSHHIKKSAAKRRAKREAGQMDSIIVHRTDGTVQGSI